MQINFKSKEIEECQTESNNAYDLLCVLKLIKIDLEHTCLQFLEVAGRVEILGLERRPST